MFWAFFLTILVVAWGVFITTAISASGGMGIVVGITIVTLAMTLAATIS